MHHRDSPIRARAPVAPALFVLSGLLFSVGPSSLSAQACLGESPLTNRTVSLTTGLAVSEAVVPEVSVRTALPDGFTVGAGWNRLDPDGEVSMGIDVPAHDIWSALLSVELELGSGDASLCPLARVARAEWSRIRVEPSFPGTSNQTRTSTILVAGLGYALTLPPRGKWAPALFARAEVQRHWGEDRFAAVDGSSNPWGAVTARDLGTSTEFMSRFGVVLPWERWTGSAWVGLGTVDGRPMTPHAAGDPVFGMSLGVSF